MMAAVMAPAVRIGLFDSGCCAMSRAADKGSESRKGLPGVQ